ncbi:P2RX1_2 [Blepharisma stoltei]|uniref:Uncharacterized protein n=1 Tax=Blepharisma stoltei TaxID=1481888 RepID=A0AAU9J8M0_9CILI|nr:unnamed protein product [Blepharisma stoltei]
MLEKILGKDPDEVFAYMTARMLIIRDLLMSLIDWSLQTLIVVYVIFYCFLILQRYNIKATWDGYIYYRITGKGYSETDGIYYPWDHGDLVYPEQDGNGFNLGVHCYRVDGQQMGYCTNACESDDDCSDKEPYEYKVCTDNGYCKSLTWCPDLASISSSELDESKIYGVGNFVINLWAGIDFPQFDTDEYVNYESKKPVSYPEEPATKYTINDILSEAGIESMDEVRKTGAIIEIIIDWKCKTKETTCDPTLSVARLDGASEDHPVSFTRSNHYYKDGVLTRDFKKFIGLKFMIRSEGLGYEFSLLQTVLQISSGLALLKLMTTITDFIMLNLYPNKKKRAAFKKFKVEESVDFTDKGNRIDYIRFLRERRENQPNEE